MPPSGWFASLLAGLLVVLPLGGVAIQAAREWAASGRSGPARALDLTPSWGLLGNTLMWSVGIGLLAAVVAWPAAWVVRRAGLVRAAWVLVPLALPSYFAYAGYGLIRAPGTPVGNWVEGLVASGWGLAPLVASRVVAVVGLVLWAWPVAALVMGGLLRRIDEGVLDQSRLELGPARRMLLLARLGLPAFGAGAAMVALLMVGSAVPLHVSQTPTYAVRVWFELTLRPGSALVWLSAWPILAVAALAGWGVGAWLERWTRLSQRSEGAAAVGAGAEGARSGSPRGLLGASAGACLAIVLSVGVPAALFVWSVREWASVGKFWSLHGGALRDSLGVAAACGAGLVAITVVVWRAMLTEGRSARLAGYSVRLLLVAGLTPGVLVGLAWLRTAALGPAWLSDSVVVLVLAHLSRYGFLGALAGCWLAASEARGLRDLRLMDGAAGWAGWMGWWRTSGLRQGGVVMAMGVVGAALSLHETEASVVVAPVYVQSLAQAMLGYLHFARMEELSVGALMLLALTAAAGGMTALAGWAAARRRWESRLA